MGASWSDGRTDGCAEIDDVMPPNGWTTLCWAFDRGYAFGRVTTFLAHEEPGPAELARPGFTVLDVGGGWRFSKALELRLTVRNATDKLYVAAPDNAADFAAGRSVTVALAASCSGPRPLGRVWAPGTGREPAPPAASIEAAIHRWIQKGISACCASAYSRM